MRFSSLNSSLLYFIFAFGLVLGAPASVNEETVGVAKATRDEGPLLHRAHDPAPVLKYRQALNNAVSKRETNGIRAANGLPPLAPRRLHGGTKSNTAHKARASHVRHDAILVYDANGLSGTFLGYVSKTFAYQSYFLTTDVAQALLDPVLSGGNIINSASPGGFSYVGLSGSSRTISNDLADFAYICGTSQTAAGATAWSTSGGGASNLASGLTTWVESAVWSIGSGNELIPTWINWDNAPITMEIAYWPSRGNSLVTARNLQRLKQGWTDLVKIRLFWSSVYI